jgi:hypothetical protein
MLLQQGRRVAVIYLLSGVFASCSDSSGSTPIISTDVDAASNADAVERDEGAADGGADAGTDAFADSGPVITPELCVQMCEVVYQVNCPGMQTLDNCVADCLGQATLCTREGLASYKCIIGNGPAALTCDAEFAVLKAGYCAQEQSDLLDCLRM